MDLLTFINDLGRRKRLADALGKSPDYLWQIGAGWNGRKPSPQLAIDIERETARLNDRVSADDLRPDLQFIRDGDGQVTGYHIQLSAA